MLHTHADFLNAIAAQPSDRTLRLVYADWLDEQSQPHGELICVEEEMRALPVFSDRFWELKPRRNTLRSQVGAEWCGQMRYGTECEPVFRHGIPDGWRERWRLIREFTERWHRVPMPDVGGRQKEIADAEARLGRQLPPSVREWLAFAHDMDRRYLGSLHVFRDNYEMEDLPDHAALSLLCQSEGDYRWAVEHPLLERSDPPVRGYGVQFGTSLTHDPDDERYPRAETLTEFALTYGMIFTHGDCGAGANLVLADPEPLLSDLAATFPPPVQFGARDFYERDNLIIIAEPASWTPGVYFRMRVFKPLPPAQLPPLLWERSSNGQAARPPIVAEEADDSPPLPPAGPNDPIPF